MRYEDFVDISLQNWTGLRGHFLYISVFFLKVHVQDGDIFGVAKNYKYFLGLADIPYIFWG